MEDLPTPRTSHLQRFERVFPGTRTVFDSELWVALDPRLHRVKGNRHESLLGTRSRAAAAALDEGRPEAASSALKELDVLALAVIRFHIAKLDPKADAFVFATPIVGALCFPALTRRLESIVPLLGSYIDEFLLWELCPLSTARGEHTTLGANLDSLVQRSRHLSLMMGYQDHEPESDSLWQTKITVIRRLIHALARSHEQRHYERLEHLWGPYTVPRNQPRLDDVPNRALFRLQR